MRNALRARRASRVAHHLEQLEARQLLSVSLAGTMLSNSQVSQGVADFTIDNAPSNMHTVIHVGFQREVDSTLPSPVDNFNITADFYTLDTNTWQGNLSSSPSAGSYSVTTSATGSSLRLTGNFPLDGSAFGVTFAHASLSLVVNWTRTSIAQHVESAGLVVGDGLRELTVSLSDFGPATAAGTFTWTQGSPQILSTLPASPITTNATSANLSTGYEQTNALPDSLSLKSLIQDLSPPDSAPKNSKVAVHSTQAASTGLVINSGSPDNGIRVSQGQDYFTNPQVIPGSAFVAFSSPEGDFGGFSSTGMSVSADGASADAKGGGTGAFVDGLGNFISAPFNLDLHWQADPATAVITLARTTTTTPTTVTTEFSQQTDYDALVTGTAFFNLPGTLPTFAANGELSEFRNVTITTPLPVKGQVPTLPDATLISRTDWQNIVVKPWQSTLSLADSDGFLGGKGKGKIFVITIRKALRFHYSCLSQNHSLN